MKRKDYDIIRKEIAKPLLWIFWAQSITIGIVSLGVASTQEAKGMVVLILIVIVLTITPLMFVANKLLDKEIEELLEDKK